MADRSSDAAPSSRSPSVPTSTTSTTEYVSSIDGDEDMEFEIATEDTNDEVTETDEFEYEDDDEGDENTEFLGEPL